MQEGKMVNDADALRAVCEQRDRAFDAIDRLVGAFWSAHHNGAFDAEDKGEGHRCSCGYGIQSVFGGCSNFDKDGCRGWDCPMGFHHRVMYEKVRAATEVIRERLAERRPFDLSRIPQYDAKKTYRCNFRWFAKMLLCFFTEFRCVETYTQERTKEFADAYSRLLRIGLANYGVILPDDLFDNCSKMKYVEGSPEAEALTNALKGFVEECGKKYVASGDMELKGDLLLERMANDADFTLYWLVSQALLFMGDFSFGKDYPGADVGVYLDYIHYLRQVCARVMGCRQNDFDIIMAMNDTDDEGLEII